jgi:predicted cobalt transporter CbtA
VEKKLILRGSLAGGLGGLLAFVFARIFAEPVIQKAIDYESARDDAQSVLDKAAGLPVEAAGPDIFSRAVQRNAGIGVGMIVFGLAMGALVAVAYSLCLGRTGRLQARPLALLVAAAGFVVIFLAPFAKYPANPPAIGHEETIHTRGSLFLTMLVTSLIASVIMVRLGQVLALRLGNWNATIIAGLGYVAVIALAMALLPQLGHLHANVAEYGRHATETPLPLTDATGKIVFPGFPADVLAEFRVYSVAAQLIMWSTIGLVFAPLADRVLNGKRAPHAVGEPILVPSAY